MKITKRVTFDSPEEALRYACKYFACMGWPAAYNALNAEFAGLSDRDAAVEGLQRAARTWLPQNEGVEPTYTDSEGKTHLIRSMASRHIRNALIRYPDMPLGLHNVLAAELRRRTNNCGETSEYRK